MRSSPLAPERPYRDYLIYGMVVRSEIPLSMPACPEGSSPDVTLSLEPESWFAERPVVFPAEDLEAWWYQRAPQPDGSERLHWPGLFEFLVSADGRRVVCGLLEGASHESFQNYLLSRVLSYALVKQGQEPLHATAVVVEGRAVAFLGQSGRGKSTLAAAFVRAGHTVLTDDLLLVREVEGVLCAFPGPKRIKLYPEAAERFLPGVVPSAPLNPDAVKLILALDREQAHHEPVPIQAFLVLDGRVAHEAVRLVPLVGVSRFTELLAATFNRRLVTPDRLHRQFVAARQWAARVPVCRLEYPRSLDRIDEVRRTVADAATSPAPGFA